MAKKNRFPKRLLGRSIEYQTWVEMGSEEREQIFDFMAEKMLVIALEWDTTIEDIYQQICGRTLEQEDYEFMVILRDFGDHFKKEK